LVIASLVLFRWNISREEQEPLDFPWVKKIGNQSNDTLHIFLTRIVVTAHASFATWYAMLAAECSGLHTRLCLKSSNESGFLQTSFGILTSFGISGKPGRLIPAGSIPVRALGSRFGKLGNKPPKQPTTTQAKTHRHNFAIFNYQIINQCSDLISHNTLSYIDSIINIWTNCNYSIEQW